MSTYEELRQLADLPPSEDAQPKIIQYRGQRLGIRMEPSYWTALKAQAREQGCRLNALVHSLYTDPRALGNRTAFLRQSTVKWLAGELADARRKLELDHSEMMAVLRTTRRPAILSTQDNGVSRVNDAFRDWILTRTGSEDDLHTIRIGFRASRDSIRTRLQDGGGSLRNEPAAILVPGRALCVSLDVVQLNGADTGEEYLAILNPDTAK